MRVTNISQINMLSIIAADEDFSVHTSSYKDSFVRPFDGKLSMVKDL